MLKGPSLQVTVVLKDIDVLMSQTNAELAYINANAAAQAFLLKNEATADGFTLLQQAKATQVCCLSTQSHSRATNSE